MIEAFKNKYAFLSNFYDAPISFHGLTFRNNEAAFQSEKCPDRRTEFCALTASEAKKLGRKVHLRDDWELIKESVMYDVCLAKFTQNPELKAMLLATGDEELVEGNTWGDTTWGVCNGIGQNLLGLILMRVRRELQEEENTKCVCQFCSSLTHLQNQCRDLSYAGKKEYLAGMILKVYDKNDTHIETVKNGYYRLNFCPECGKPLTTKE